MVLSRNPVHSALLLVLTLFGIAVEFVNQQADFLAAVQVIVYAGAIVILFLFVIMLLGVDRSESLAKDPLKGQRPVAVILGVVILVELVVHRPPGQLVRPALPLRSPVPSRAPGTTSQKLGQSIFTRYLLPFEITVGPAGDRRGGSRGPGPPPAAGGMRADPRRAGGGRSMTEVVDTVRGAGR